MARGGRAGGAAGGGVGIQAPRPRRARLASGVAAAAACVLLGAYPGSVSPADAGPVLVVGLCAVLVLVFSLVTGWTSGIAWTLVLLAGAYAVSLALDDADFLDPAAPLYAAGLLLMAELAYWSLELRGPGREEASVVLRRLAALAVLAFLSVVLGAFVVIVTAAPLGGGLLWDAVGVLAAAATVGILALLARRAET